MRPFNKIFIIALPRCATVSMTQALGLLGIRTAHLGKIYGDPSTPIEETEQPHFDLLRLKRMKQQIEANDYDLDILRECQGLADYPVCCPKVIGNLDRQFPGSLFVNVRRENSIDRWLQSVEIQFVGTELLGLESPTSPSQNQLLEVIRCFRKWTFGSESFDFQIYRSRYDEYQAWVADYFYRRDQLLDFADLQQLTQYGFQRLCEFLRIELVPAIDFPRCNSHSHQPAFAFFESLLDGKIQSQTGVRPGR